MDQIREKIQQTIANLSDKKRILEKHKAQYIDLKFKLYDYEKYSEHDTPEVEVKLTSKAKVNAHVLNPKKILVFLGTEYFVERDPKQAIKQIENKLDFLNKTIDEFDTKIKEAEKTIENIKTLETMDEKKKSLAAGSSAENGSHNEEGLPFMDIREDLDDDGNVINGKLEPHNENKVKELGDYYGVDLIEEGDEIQQLLNDMEITPKSKIEEVTEPVEILSSHTADISSKVEKVDTSSRSDKSAISEQVMESHDSEESAIFDIVERDLVYDFPENSNSSPVVVSDIVEREPVKELKNIDLQENKIIKADTEEVAVSSPAFEYYQLLQELGIKNIHIEPIETNAIEERHHSDAHQEGISSDHQECNTDNGSNGISQEQVTFIETLTAKYPSGKPALDEDELLQLQLTSDDLEDIIQDDTDEPGEYDCYYDEADFQASLNNDFDEEDNDFKDWDEYGDEDNRDGAYYDEGKIERDNAFYREGIVPPSYKDLFAKELEKVRNQNSNGEPGASKSTSKGLEKDLNSILSVNKNQNKLKKKKSVQFDDDLQIKEIENVSEQLKMIETGRVSRFKQGRLDKNIGGIKYPKITSTQRINDFDETVSDIIEKPSFLESDIKNKSEPLPDKNIDDDQEAIVSDIRESKSPLNDIFEKDVDVKGTIKPLNNDKAHTIKQSKFKSLQKNALKNYSSSTVIEIPKNEPFPITEDTNFDHIKSYVENEEFEDEDEALLNLITDNISVYRGDDEGEIDEDEDDEDGVMLVDEIVENEDVENPDYFVDDNLLEREYLSARRAMMEKYLSADEKREIQERKSSIKPKAWEFDGEELEPIDESGNPLTVSRFKKSLNK